ncbi:GerAB/ArcD/ProY family transporter [Ectobacillus ponti]|uniref:GerAB/ArcD/ProY family transporter n=1 Tax=Ectobacillus ponti TaxID=2961894 RepID=A0AA42BPS6_9BACI|nr:GerAB/ArcD/ProY family transporter [Ectobacillus ponti]MCP8969475.1 GerAB/ArcD/ProY family transporter [Ectobacillus ponti]
MNRYFLYLIMLNMLTNVVAYVPHMLLEERLSGSVLSMLIAVPIGLLFSYIFYKTMSKFPGETYPQIVKRHMPGWLVTVYVLFVSLMWFAAGLLTLQAFSHLSERFIDPEINPGYLIGIYLVVVCFGAVMKSDRILYALELVMIFCVPLVLLIFFKAYANEYMSWDAVLESLSHYREPPSWNGVAAASYTMLGISNLAVFNRILKGKITWKYWLLIGVGGMVNLFTTMYIPIGVNGVEGIQDYVYPWIMTADALRMEYGFIERVLFVFLLLYLAMSLVYVSILWHVSIELGKEVLPGQKLKWKGMPVVPGIFLLAFCSISISLALKVDEYLIYNIGRIYLQALLPINILAAGLMIWIVWREKKWRPSESSS